MTSYVWGLGSVMKGFSAGLRAHAEEVGSGDGGGGTHAALPPLSATPVGSPQRVLHLTASVLSGIASVVCRGLYERHAGAYLLRCLCALGVAHWLAGRAYAAYYRERPAPPAPSPAPAPAPASKPLPAPAPAPAPAPCSGSVSARPPPAAGPVPAPAPARPRRAGHNSLNGRGACDAARPAPPAPPRPAPPPESATRLIELTGAPISALRQPGGSARAASDSASEEEEEAEEAEEAFEAGAEHSTRPCIVAESAHRS